MKRMVQFGAGSIGRSLVGQLFSRAGYEVVFIDAVPEIIDALNHFRSYNVVVKDKRPDRIVVDHVRGIHAANEDAVAAAVAYADVIGTAVGPNALPRIFAPMASGLQRRTRPVSIILCENLRNVKGFVREGLQKHLPPDFDWCRRVGLVETSIGKMVPIMPDSVRRRDPLEVWAEAYNQIIADEEGFVGPIPQVEGLVLKRNFAAYVDRKLYIHNLGHAVAAYHGYLAGQTTIWECMAVPEVRAEARSAMLESAEALLREYPQEFTRGSLTDHIEDLLSRFDNPALGDTVFRVGRDLYRKLAPEDRLVGALRLALKHGVPAEHIQRGIAAGLCFRAVDEKGEPFPADVEFGAELERSGPAGVLQSVCGLSAETDRPTLEAILVHYERYAARRPT